MAPRRPGDDDRQAALRLPLSPCRPPHGGLEDLLSGDAFIEELARHQQKITWPDEPARHQQRGPRA